MEASAPERKTEGATKRALPLHPFLFAAVPVLALWLQNLSEGVTLGDVIPPLLVIGGGAGVVMLVAAVLLRGSFLKGGLVAAAAVLLAFTYGPLTSLVGRWSVGGVRIAPPPVIAGLCLAALVVWVVAIVPARPSRVAGLTRGLNFVAAGLVAINAAAIGLHEFRNPDVHVDASRILGAAVEGSGPQEKRDIYFIVLDDYGGERAMRELLGYDNRPFLAELERRGFYVPAHPSTNYPRTSMYLAAALNLQYVQDLVPPETPITEGVLRSLVMDDLVPSFLKEKGYRYIHIGSWVKETATNPQADVNVVLGHGLSEFSKALVGESVLQPALEEFGSLDWDRQQYERALFQWDQLVKSQDVDGPNFVFAHFIVPHWPYVFDETGQFSEEGSQVTVDDIKGSLDRVPLEIRERYVKQLQFANSKTLEAIDALLAEPAESRPIIVLQSDEGFFTWLTRGEIDDDRALQQHFSILDAYYFPGVEDTGLYPSITPVNSFRVLFNAYFGARLPLLPDRNHVIANQIHGFHFADVTDRVRPLL